MSKRFKKTADLSGKRFGKLVVLAFSHTGKEGRYWTCTCICCGQTKEVVTNQIRRIGAKVSRCTVDETRNDRRQSNWVPETMSHRNCGKCGVQLPLSRYFTCFTCMPSLGEESWFGCTVTGEYSRADYGSQKEMEIL